jgi:hypothetical protein
VVTAHYIHCNAHKENSAEKEFFPRSGKSDSGGDFDGNDLAAIIKPASGADPVRDEGRRALGTSAQLRQGQGAVIGSAHALAAVGRLSFRNTHSFLILEF